MVTKYAFKNYNEDKDVEAGKSNGEDSGKDNGEDNSKDDNKDDGKDKEF